MKDKHAFYRSYVINQAVKCANNIRNDLLFELTANTTNPTIVNRRCRMLKQLSLLESQIITKLSNFRTNDYKDYERAIKFIVNELNIVTSRNA
jgi:hypothetical protein